MYYETLMTANSPTLLPKIQVTKKTRKNVIFGSQQCNNVYWDYHPHNYIIIPNGILFPTRKGKYHSLSIFGSH